MMKIGITGGIGSGKTTVCKIFQTLGIPIYYADDAAKWLMEHDVELMTALKKQFGDHLYDAQQKLNRPFLASIVFSDKEALKTLENLVHPAVHKHGMAWMAAQAKKGVPYVLKEAALIFESGSHRFLDKVITVFAPETLRIERVVTRDKVTVEQVKARINKQLPESEKLRLADYIIYNDGKQNIQNQIMQLHEMLSALNHTKTL